MLLNCSQSKPMMRPIMELHSLGFSAMKRYSPDCSSYSWIQRFASWNLPSARSRARFTSQWAM